MTDFRGKTSIFSHPVYLFLRKFSLQDSRGGSIAESWRQQPCTPSYCCDWEAAAMLRAFPLAKKGEGRARLPSLYASFGKLGETPTHEDIINNNRSINWPV
nr:hypothetical protein [Escherichia coli]